MLACSKAAETRNKQVTLTVTVTLTATNGTIGGVQDADASAAGIQLTGSVAQVNTALAAATFTATAAGAASVGIAVSDGSLNASGTYNLTAVTAPTLSTALGGVNNLDARSDIVLTASENVTAVAGKYITITNTGGIGFHGENTDNSFLTIDATDDRVTISGGKITIDLDVDLDLANNYTLSIQEGAFLGAVSGQDSVALAPVSFSTVAPMLSATPYDPDTNPVPEGFATGTTGTLAQTMDSTGSLVDSAYWLDLQDRSSLIANPTSINAAASDKNFVFVFADYDRVTPNGNSAGDDGIGTGDFYVRLYNFGLGDMIYIDTLGANTDQSSVREQHINFSGGGTFTPSGGVLSTWTGINFVAAGEALGGTIELSLASPNNNQAFDYSSLATVLGATNISTVFAVL
jgi:hypothetical protein